MLPPRSQLPSRVKTAKKKLQKKAVRQGTADCLKNNFQYICTVFHEITHAVDFYRYASNRFNGNYEEMTKSYDYSGFKMWTEFNAKFKSYSYYSNLIKIAYNGIDNGNICLDQIESGEVDMQNNEVETSIKENNWNIAIYYIIQYLGRYYCWELEDEKKFINGKMFPDIFKNKLEPEVKELYSLLKMSPDTLFYYSQIDDALKKLRVKLILIDSDDSTSPRILE